MKGNKGPGHIHILVVDDDVSIRKVLQQAVKHAGYECSTSGSGEEALAFLDKKDVDLVITDIRMPGISGIELLKLVKKNYDSDVIVMTGFTADFTYEEIIEIGASDFIQKPFSITEIIARMETVLRERSLLAG